MEWKTLEEELPRVWEDFIIEWDSIWQKAHRRNKTTIVIFWHKEEYIIPIEDILYKKWFRVPRIK